MKKYFSKLLILTIGLSLILGGCKMEKVQEYGFDDNTPEEFAQRVCTETEKKYNEDFEIIDYVTPYYDLNAQGKYNMVLLKNSEGLYVTVKSPVTESDTFYDNYINKKMEAVYQEMIDFRGLDNFKINTYDINDEPTLHVDEVEYVTIRFNIFEEPEEEVLKKAYEVRNGFVNAGIKIMDFKIVFLNDFEAKEKYPESYFIHPEWLETGIVKKVYEIYDQDEILNSKEVMYEDFVEELTN